MSGSGSAGANCRLVADIGGTNARFALLSDQGALYHERVLACADYPSLVEAIEAYLDTALTAQPRQAILAVATATVSDTISLTNHSWSFSIAETRARLGFERLSCINDFTALALSLPHLSTADLRQIGGGPAKPASAIALLGAGTGLGVSGLLYTPQGWFPLQGEGGHISYGPLSAREQAVWTVINRHTGHVSAERLLSGQGLVNIYQALRELDDPAADDLQQPALITERGLQDQCVLCTETLALFCAALGTVAGNLALTLGAQGGVYIGGGIVPRLGTYFDNSAFRHRFEQRGRFTAYLQTIPVYIITAATPALRGAAQAFDPFYADIGWSSREC